jgi:hypothetical protein
VKNDYGTEQEAWTLNGLEETYVLVKCVDLSSDFHSRVQAPLLIWNDVKSVYRKDEDIKDTI